MLATVAHLHVYRMYRPEIAVQNKKEENNPHTHHSERQNIYINVSRRKCRPIKFYESSIRFNIMERWLFFYLFHKNCVLCWCTNKMPPFKLPGSNSTTECDHGQFMDSVHQRQIVSYTIRSVYLAECVYLL